MFVITTNKPRPLAHNMVKVVYCEKHYLDVVLSEGKCFRCILEDEEE